MSAKKPICLFLAATLGRGKEKNQKKHKFDVFYQSSLWKTALIVV